MPKRPSSKSPRAGKRSKVDGKEEQEQQRRAEEEAAMALAEASGDDMSDDEELPPQVTDYPRPPTVDELNEGDPGSLTGPPIRLYADGIFDIFHFGHARALQQCKQAYPNVYLMVGCCNDALTHELKGNTVMNETERYEGLRHCKWVDEVVEDAPWVLTDEFLEEHDIHYVCHDALPYGDASGEASEGDVYARLKRLGKFYETQRTDGISTSDLINRIVKEYDQFVRRNLDRGYSAKDMNVPFIKEQSIRLDIAIDKVKERTGAAKHQLDSVRERSAGAVHAMADKAEHAIADVQRGFLMLFERQSPLRTRFRAKRRQLQRQISDFARESLC